MKRKIHSSIICYLIMGVAGILCAQVPQVDWVYTFGGTGYDGIWSSKLDGQGNIINVGTFNNTVDFDQGPGLALGISNPGMGSMFIQKLNAQGNFLWVQVFQGYDWVSGYCLAMAGDGSVFISGKFASDSLDCDPDPNSTSYVYKGPYASATYIIKLDSQGNFLWGIAQGGEVIAERLTVDMAGNLYVIGNYDGPFDSDPDPSIHSQMNPQAIGKKDFYVQKLNPSGYQLWLKTVKGTDDVIANCIALNTAGEPVVVGQFKKTVDFDPGPGSAVIVPSHVNFKGFILELDTLGGYKNILYTSGAGLAKYVDIRVDSGDYIYLAGVYDGLADLDPGTGVANPRTVASKGWFIQKLNPDGTLNWLHPYENSLQSEQTRPLKLAIDQFGNVNVGGYFPGGALFHLNPTDSNGIILTPVSPQDIFVAKHDSTGALLWGHSFGAPGYDRALNILSNDLGNLYISGFYSLDVNFDPYSSLTRTSSGSYDCFVLKFNPCPPARDTSLQVSSCKYFDVRPGLRVFSDTLLADTLASTTGCDSVVNYNIDIYRLSSIYEGIGSLHWDGSSGSPVTFSWLNCDNQTLIPGQTEPDIFVTQNGSYALIVSDGSCTDTSACLTIDNIGLDESHTFSELAIYPNPVDDILRISGEKDKVYNLSLYDITGRKVKSETNKDFMDVSVLAPGTYFLKIERGSKSTVRKIIHR